MVLMKEAVKFSGKLENIYGADEYITFFLIFWSLTMLLTEP